MDSAPMGRKTLNVAAPFDDRDAVPNVTPFAVRVRAPVGVFVPELLMTDAVNVVHVI